MKWEKSRCHDAFGCDMFSASPVPSSYCRRGAPSSTVWYFLWRLEPASRTFLLSGLPAANQFGCGCYGLPVDWCCISQLSGGHLQLDAGLAQLLLTCSSYAPPPELASGHKYLQLLIAYREYCSLLLLLCLWNLESDENMYYM